MFIVSLILIIFIVTLDGVTAYINKGFIKDIYTYTSHSNDISVQLFCVRDLNHIGIKALLKGALTQDSINKFLNHVIIHISHRITFHFAQISLHPFINRIGWVPGSFIIFVISLKANNVRHVMSSVRLA